LLARHATTDAAKGEGSRRAADQEVSLLREDIRLQKGRIFVYQSQKPDTLVLQFEVFARYTHRIVLNFDYRFFVHLLSLFLSLEHAHQLVVGLYERLDERLHRIESLMEGSKGASVIISSSSRLKRRVCANSLIVVVVVGVVWHSKVRASLVALIALSVGIPCLARLNCDVLVAEAAHPTLSVVVGLDEGGSAVLVLWLLGLLLILLLLLVLLSGLPRVGEGGHLDLVSLLLRRSETKLTGGLVVVSGSSVGDELSHFFFFFSRMCLVRFS
jgi:hypothetical protein